MVEKKRALVVRGFKDSIRFEHVGFAYESDGEMKPVLHGIDLDVKRGEVIAIVGPSGAGKSSLVNLIPRFFDVSSGRILDRWPRPARCHAWPRCASRSAK